MLCLGWTVRLPSLPINEQSSLMEKAKASNRWWSLGQRINIFTFKSGPSYGLPNPFICAPIAWGIPFASNLISQTWQVKSYCSFNLCGIFGSLWIWSVVLCARGAGLSWSLAGGSSVFISLINLYLHILKPSSPISG